MAISRPAGVSHNCDRINVATFANRGTAVTSRCFKSFMLCCQSVRICIAPCHRDPIFRPSVRSRGFSSPVVRNVLIAGNTWCLVALAKRTVVVSQNRVGNFQQSRHPHLVRALWKYDRISLSCCFSCVNRGLATCGVRIPISNVSIVDIGLLSVLQPTSKHN